VRLRLSYLLFETGADIVGEGTPLRDPSPIKNIGEGLTINAGYALLGIMMIYSFMSFRLCMYIHW
jgi:hypothetical protein